MLSMQTRDYERGRPEDYNRHRPRPPQAFQDLLLGRTALESG